MMCENVYQSERCCEFSELTTTPCQTLTYPHLQIGTRPIHSSTAATTAIRVAAATLTRLDESPAKRRSPVAGP